MTIENSESQRALVPSAPSAARAYSESVYRIFTRRLGWRGLTILLAAGVAAGVFLDWKWLVAVGAAPIIIAVLPCAAMCAIGVCAMGGSKASCSKTPETSGSNLAPHDQSTEPLPTRPRD